MNQIEQTSSVKRIAVIGAGISGLACAYRLQREARARGINLRVDLFEASDRSGGVIATSERDGFTIDEGPDCFISTKPEALQLSNELGLNDQMISTSTVHRRSFILFRGRPTPIPPGFFLLAPTSLRSLAATPLLSWHGKLRAALDWVIPKRAQTELGSSSNAGSGLRDECLADFVRRRFGNEVLERIAQPMVAGIYTADPEKLSLAATFPQFLKMESEEGSVIRALMRKTRAGESLRPSLPAKNTTGSAREDDTAGAKQAAGPRYGMFVSYKRGMGVIPRTLEAALTPGTLHLKAGVRELAALPGGRWRLLDAQGDWHELDGICMALPLVSAARVLSDVSGSNAQARTACKALAESMQGVRYASSAIVTCAYKREQIAHKLDGMGMVIPAIEKREILAASFSSVKWDHRAPDGHVLIRAFIGGALQEHLAELEPEQLEALAKRELASILGISGEPLFVQVNRWPQRMAQYEVGHLDRVAAIRELEGRVEGLALAGNGFDGVGIPDCIRHAERAASELLARVGART